MSVYNHSQYLNVSIPSILNQTEKDFEFIIIDDGSKDSSWDRICCYSDPRIVSIRDTINRGFTYRLNQFLDISKGDFIARLDADDISYPTRIEKQIQKFTTGIGFVGCWARSVDKNGVPKIGFVEKKCRCSDEDLKSLYPKTICMADPTIIYSREATNKIGYYDKGSLTGESYNYTRRVQRYFPGRVVQEVLYIRRIKTSTQLRQRDMDVIKLANERAEKFPIIPRKN